MHLSDNDKHMKFLDKIKNFFKSSPPEPDMVHYFFGPLHAEVCGDESDYWESERVFQPLGLTIIVFIRAGSEGPTEKQVDFYKWFEANYESEFEWISNALIKEFESSFKKKLDVPFLKSFEISSITIPRNGNRNDSWEISFECSADPDGHLFTAEILENKVINVRTDG